ncbi:MAG: FKBP-type peptidyl-prolyl cis-trans isomerase [Acidobacteriota bacterium]
MRPLLDSSLRGMTALLILLSLLAPALLAQEDGDDVEWVELKKGLFYQDLVVGDGNEAGRGSFVQVRYVGTLEDGSIFDQSKENGFAFKMGDGRVIRGWELGIAGMKVGGKRRLKIPPKLGYGSAGVKGRIPKKATLLFDIELISANKPR